MVTNSSLKCLDGFYRNRFIASEWFSRTWSSGYPRLSKYLVGHRWKTSLKIWLTFRTRAYDDKFRVYIKHCIVRAIIPLYLPTRWLPVSNHEPVKKILVQFFGLCWTPTWLVHAVICQDGWPECRMIDRLIQKTNALSGCILQGEWYYQLTCWLCLSDSTKVLLHS